MKISLKWLSEYVEVSEFFAKPHELAARLTDAGLEVEGIEDLSLRFQNVVVGHILEKAQHSGADRLSLCQVATGDGVVQQIVCGAQNHKTGDNVVVALPGASLPAQQPGGKELVIGRSAIRGVESAGMLCSKKELGLEYDPQTDNGILILPPEATVGAPFAAYMGLDDVAFELKVTPNRSDCLSHFGLAREIACLLGREAELPVESFFEASETVSSRISVEVREPEMCGRYAGRFIAGVKIGPSPDWLRKKLEAVGAKSINNVVDATNFTMLELGQPLHAFDAREIRGGKIEVATARAGEKFVTLDGTELTLHGEELTIRDSERALVLAGVIGGANSGVKDDTVDLFLECAYFNPAAIRRSSRRHRIETDSSYRFARGTNPEAVPLALSRAAALIQKVAGGAIFGGALDLYPEPYPRRRIELRLLDVASRLGYEIDGVALEDWMKRLGCDVERSSRAGAEATWTITPPTFRWDLTIDVDLIEEYARLNGYDKIPETAPPFATWPTESAPEFQLSARTRRSFVEAGFMQAINYAFVSAEFQTTVIGDAAAWERAGLACSADPVALLNPLSEDLGVMRSALAPGMLKNFAHNSRFGNAEGRLFELGFAHSRGKDAAVGGGYKQEARLGLIAWGEPTGLWTAKPSAPQVLELKQAIEGWLRQLQISRFEWIAPADLDADPNGGGELPRCLHPGQCAVLFVEDKPVGFIGGLHPLLQANLKAREPAALGELSLDKILLQGPARALRATSISRFPAVERDFAFVMPTTLAAGKVASEIRKAAGELAQEVRAFDVYEGAPLAPGTRSVAFRLVLQDLTATLDDARVNQIRDRVIDACQQKFSICLR